MVISGVVQFFKDRAADIKRIARASEGDVEVGDVESEAWLLATEMAQKRGTAIDLSEPQAQDSLLGALFNRLVKFAEKHLRFAVRLDDGSEDEEPSTLGAFLARVLRAPASSRPDARLVREQEEQEIPAAVEESYSEASAYVLLLVRHEWDRQELADLLQIGQSTLEGRVRKAAAKFESEASLFDGVSKIPRDFAPTIDRARTLRRAPTGLSPNRQQDAFVLSGS